MDEPVPLPNVSAKILAKVVEYCKFHAMADKEGEDGAKAVKEDEIKAKDADFVKVDQGTLFELILVRAGAARPAQGVFPPPGFPGSPTRRQAANFLNIKALLDLTCLTVANMIKGAPPVPSAASQGRAFSTIFPLSIRLGAAGGGHRLAACEQRRRGPFSGPALYAQC